MGFDSLIIGLTTNIVKNVTKFEGSVDDLNKKFELQCPSKKELLAFIKTKNRISDALTQIQQQFNTLNKTESTLSGLVGTLTTITTVIKALPAPTAIAGVGIPISVLTNLSDVLDFVGNKISQGKGSLESIPEIISLLEGYIEGINTKLQTLDQNILKCLEKQGVNAEEVGLQLTPDQVEEGISLEDRLQPGSESPLRYRGYLLTLEYDSSNEFPFPRRRIRGVNNLKTILGDFSYSATTPILVEEVKFKIDNSYRIFT